MLHRRRPAARRRIPRGSTALSSARPPQASRIHSAFARSIGPTQGNGLVQRGSSCARPGGTGVPLASANLPSGLAGSAW